MLIDQQQKSTETLQEYVQRFSDLLIKSSGSLPHHANDLAHIMYQKLQHNVLDKNPTSVQNSITIAQKKDAELCIIEGLHNHDPENEINHLTNKQYES